MLYIYAEFSFFGVFGSTRQLRRYSKSGVPLYVVWSNSQIDDLIDSIKALQRYHAFPSNDL